MCSLKFFASLSFFMIYYWNQVYLPVGANSQAQFFQVGQSGSSVNTRTPIQFKSILQAHPLTQKRSLLKAEEVKKIKRRGIPFQTMYLSMPEDQRMPPGDQFYLPVQPSPLRPLVKPNETEAERAERIHKSFDRLLTFVEIVGQVDNYVSSKWKNLVKTVSNFYEVEEDPHRVNAKRMHGICPNAG